VRTLADVPCRGASRVPEGVRWRLAAPAALETAEGLPGTLDSDDDLMAASDVTLPAAVDPLPPGAAIGLGGGGRSVSPSSLTAATRAAALAASTALWMLPAAPSLLVSRPPPAPCCCCPDVGLLPPACKVALKGASAVAGWSCLPPEPGLSAPTPAIGCFGDEGAGICLDGSGVVDTSMTVYEKRTICSDSSPTTHSSCPRALQIRSPMQKATGGLLFPPEVLVTVVLAGCCGCCWQGRSLGVEVEEVPPEEGLSTAGGAEVPDVLATLEAGLLLAPAAAASVGPVGGAGAKSTTLAVLPSTTTVRAARMTGCC
jgi:hypothetical protein